MLQTERRVSGDGSLGSDAPLCELRISDVLFAFRLLLNIHLTKRRYHESVENWEFGKLSALQEIALALEGGYDYYYMGKYLAGLATA